MLCKHNRTEFEFHVESTVCSEVTVNMLTWKRSIIPYSNMVKKFAKIVYICGTVQRETCRVYSVNAVRRLM